MKHAGPVPRAATETAQATAHHPDATRSTRAAAGSIGRRACTATTRAAPVTRTGSAAGCPAAAQASSARTVMTTLPGIPDTSVGCASGCSARHRATTSVRASATAVAATCATDGVATPLPDGIGRSRPWVAMATANHSRGATR